MKSLKLPAICLQIALLLASTSIAATAKISDRNPIEEKLIIYGTCEKCSSESGDVCCPAG